MKDIFSLASVAATLVLLLNLGGCSSLEVEAVASSQESYVFRLNPEKLHLLKINVLNVRVENDRFKQFWSLVPEVDLVVLLGGMGGGGISVCSIHCTSSAGPMTAVPNIFP